MKLQINPTFKFLKKKVYIYVCTYVLCNSAVFTKMPRLSDQGGGAILLKGASVYIPNTAANNCHTCVCKCSHFTPLNAVPHNCQQLPTPRHCNVLYCTEYCNPYVQYVRIICVCKHVCMYNMCKYIHYIIVINDYSFHRFTFRKLTRTNSPAAHQPK